MMLNVDELIMGIWNNCGGEQNQETEKKWIINSVETKLCTKQQTQGEGQHWSTG